jgi:hypothetical protein
VFLQKNAGTILYNSSQLIAQPTLSNCHSVIETNHIKYQSKVKKVKGKAIPATDREGP